MDWAAPLRLARSIRKVHSAAKSQTVKPQINKPSKPSHHIKKLEELVDLTPYITIIEYLKGGAQADIKKASLIDKNGTKIVVVKQLRNSETIMKLVHLEMTTWNKANGHENVVRLLGKLLDNRGIPSMVAEYCEQGDLLSYSFSVARFNHKNLLLDILKGLKHVHELNLAHGDLKPENVVLTNQSQRLTAKICDFGSARDVLSSHRISLEYSCTALYRSPELSTEEETLLAPSFAADIWAFGCVAFVMLCKKLPYHWVKNRWTIDVFIASRKPPYSDDDQWPDTTLRHIVQSCWWDKNIRPSADALLRKLMSGKPHSRTSSQRSQPPAYSTGPLAGTPTPPGLIPFIPAPTQSPQIIRIDSTSSSAISKGAQRIRIPSPRIPSNEFPQIIRVGSPKVVPAPAEVIQIVSPATRRTRRRDYSIMDPISPPSRSRSRSTSRSRSRSRSHSPILIQIGGSRRSHSRPSTRIVRADLPASRSRSRSHTPTRIIQVGVPSQSRRSRSRSHSPTRIIQVGSTPSQRRRSRFRSPRIIQVGSPWTEPQQQPSRSPTLVVDLSPSQSQRLSTRGSPSIASHLSIADSEVLSPAAYERGPTPSPSTSLASKQSFRFPSPPPHVDDSRSWSRSRSPRIIQVGGSRSRSRSRSPRIIHVGSGSRRSRSRSQTRVVVVDHGHSRARAGSISRMRHRRNGDHSLQRSHSYSRSPPRGTRLFRTGPRDESRPREHEMTINININLTINSEGQVHVGSPRTPNSTTRRYNIHHTADLRRRTRELESPIRIQIPNFRNDSRPSRRPAPIVVHPPSQVTTDSTYSSAILHGSAAVPEPARVIIPFASPVLSAEPDETTFPHQEFYTLIRCVIVAGRKVVQKSLRRSVAMGCTSRGSFYLNHGQDMLRLKHDHLVEIQDVFHPPSIDAPTLSIEHYSTDLLSYRENLDRQNQLRVFCEILEGLGALHSSEPPIAHQCLKASNIMIDSNGSVKLSVMNSEPYVAFSTRPAPSLSYSSDWPIISRWWSPDVYQNRTALSRIENDIWAFGCVMLEVLTGAAPYSNLQPDPSLVQHILAGHTPDFGLRRLPKLKLWKDVRRCWTTPRPTTGLLLDLMCDYLSREVLKEVPDLTGKVARTMDPFVRGHSADIFSGIYTDCVSLTSRKSVVIKHVRPNHTAQKTKFILWLGDCARNRNRFVQSNICQILGVMYSAKLGPLLIYDRCAGGNLLDYLQMKGHSLRLQDKLQIMSGILDALVHLHQDQDIAWGDLHPGNIVLDESGNPKLCGLGPRPPLHHEAASRSDLSVVRYSGPERYLAEAVLPEKATDVWAFGCLIVKIASGHNPYREAQTAYGIIRAVTDGQRPYERADCENLPLWYMASSCWTEGLLQRPIATSLARRIEKIQA